jgi:hypothetical protein
MDKLIENQRIIHKVSDEKTQMVIDDLKKEYDKY